MKEKKIFGLKDPGKRNGLVKKCTSLILVSALLLSGGLGDIFTERFSLLERTSPLGNQFPLKNSSPSEKVSSVKKAQAAGEDAPEEETIEEDDPNAGLLDDENGRIVLSGYRLRQGDRLLFAGRIY